MSTNDILDRDHLARYTLGDAELEREVLQLFIGQMPQTLGHLRSSQSPKDWLQAAHSIKGAARAVGAWKLARAAETAEENAEFEAQWCELADAVANAIDEVSAKINFADMVDA